MRLDKGFLKLKSWGGAICSIIFFIVIGVYTLQKIDVLVNKRDVDILKMTNFNAVSDQDEFDLSMGFGIAAAFSAYDDETEPIDDPSVGELVFNHIKWGRNPDGTVLDGRYRISSHRCSRAELGLEDENEGTTLFPIDPNFKRDFEFYHKKLICPDVEDLRIFGGDNT